MADGGPLKWLSVVGEFTLECLVGGVRRGLSAVAVIEELAAVVAGRGAPARFRSEKLPEVRAQAIRTWLSAVGIMVAYIERAHRGRTSTRSCSATSSGVSCWGRRSSP